MPIADDLAELWASWERALKARNRSPNTLRNYRGHIVGSFAPWATHNSPAETVADIDRATIERYIADQIATRSASTAATRFRCLRAFFNWLEAEDELTTNPMAGLVGPATEEIPPPIYTDDELRRLLAVCAGNDFADRRDAATIRVLYDTGIRAGEFTGATLDALDLDAQTLAVIGKGSKGRTVALGNNTAVALDRYLRSRRRHPRQDSPALWLGVRGPLTQSGLTQLLRRRGAQAEVDDVRPHRFRHTFAHRWLAAGGQEGDLQHLAGWSTPDMIRRYGASAKAERAREAHRRLALGDDL